MKKQLATAVIALGVAATALPTFAQDNGEGVVLINTFTVPSEALDETIAMWEIARDFLDDQPGYISTQLHQSLSPDAQYRLVNVAQWESAETFMAATAAMQQSGILPRIEGVIPGPALYTVIRD